MKGPEALGASFRDPAGFVFRENGVVKRAVTEYGKANYELLMSSGLYQSLVAQKKLVSHETAPGNLSALYKVLVPEQIPVITYPYEWSFSQLKDAAILTLEIELEALKNSLSLKDATPFNIQFLNGRPIFLDTLSFEKYEDKPWAGYKQFCEFFLAPLVLMSRIKPDFNRYLAVDMAGISLEFTSRLLPRSTFFNFGFLSHIHLHAASQAKYDNAAKQNPEMSKKIASLRVSKMSRSGLVDNLLSTIKSLKIEKKRTSFGSYYATCDHYSSEADNFKQEQIKKWTASSSVAQVLDLGGNNGKYSRIFTEKGIAAVCVDADPYCVDENYLLSQKNADQCMLPLLIDLSNLTPALGWMGQERMSLLERVKPNLVLSLALIHHLRITAGISMARLADFFAQWKSALVIEFVPKEDIKVKELLAVRKDIFTDYSESDFEREFGRHFNAREKARIPGTERTLYYFFPRAS